MARRYENNPSLEATCQREGSKPETSRGVQVRGLLGVCTARV